MTPKIYVILAAAGSSRRMKRADGVNKLYLPLCKKPVLAHSIAFFEAIPFVEEIVLVAAEKEMDHCRLKVVEPFHFKKVSAIIPGGDERQQSIFQGLKFLSKKEEDTVQWVAIHDGARPFLEEKLFTELFRRAQQTHAAVPGVFVKDTMKQIDASGNVISTPPRAQLRAVQTPQIFYFPELWRAYQKAEADHFIATDDAMIYEKYIGNVQVVDTMWDNMKITTPDDWAWAQYRAESRVREERTNMSIGIGYDVHALVSGRRLILGGVEIPHEKGLQGHSDADVLVHAICDALLGAAALGDIGQHFPDTDPQFLNVDSLKLLEAVGKLLQRNGYRASHIDSVIIAQRPKLAPYIPQMREKIAQRLDIPVERLSIKATTTEHLGFTGREEGIAAQAVALLEKNG